HDRVSHEIDVKAQQYQGDSTAEHDLRRHADLLGGKLDLSSVLFIDGQSGWILPREISVSWARPPWLLRSPSCPLGSRGYCWFAPGSIWLRPNSTFPTPMRRHQMDKRDTFFPGNAGVPAGQPGEEAGEDASAPRHTDILSGRSSRPGSSSPTA